MFPGEIQLMKLIEGLRTQGLNQVFETITMLGEETLVILLAAILYFAVDKLLAHKLVFITILSTCLNGVIKNLVKRPRPWTTGQVTCLRPETATSYSFPSGHTQSFTTWATLLALHWKKALITLIAILLIAGVAFSRVYLGAHYPSDVVAALALALLCSLGGSWVFARVQDKNKLYRLGPVLFLPFALFFLIDPNPDFGDFFKTYGILVGLPFAIAIEEKYAPLTYRVPWWKKVIRVALAVAAALALKEGLKVLYFLTDPRATMVLHSLRYALMAVVVFGLGPVLIKKTGL